MVEELWQEAHCVLGQDVAARVPQPEVVVFKEEGIVWVGNMMQVPNVFRPKFAFI